MPDFTFLHLDSPLRGLDAAAPAGRIRDASRQALANLVTLAEERQVAFVLLAGDLYDGDWKDWRTGQFLAQQLARLTRAGIEVIAISGNHDAEQVLTKKLSIPGMMRAARPETRRLRSVPVAVHGQSFATPAVTDNLALAYPEPVDGLFNIGLLHTACGSTAHDNYAPCSVADLTRRGYDYWALGHVHTRSVLSEDPWVVFPGNIQGRHVKEEGSKGATLVTVDGRRVLLEHQALDVLRWLRLDVDGKRIAKDWSGARRGSGCAWRSTWLFCRPRSGCWRSASPCGATARPMRTSPAPRTRSCRKCAPPPPRWPGRTSCGSRTCASPPAPPSTSPPCARSPARWAR